MSCFFFCLRVDQDRHGKEKKGLLTLPNSTGTGASTSISIKVKTCEKPNTKLRFKQTDGRSIYLHQKLFGGSFRNCLFIGCKNKLKKKKEVPRDLLFIDSAAFPRMLTCQ